MEFVKNKNIKLAIISPSKELKAETFIIAHKELLPFNSSFYYDGFVRTKLSDEGSLIKSCTYNFLKQIVSKKIVRGKERLSFNEFALLQSFNNNKINIAFPEYGPTRASICKICKLLNIPLLVYFHGYDAYVKHIMDQYKYSQLFDYANTVFSVSKAMTKKLSKAGCAESKIVLNACAPANDFFSVKATYGQPKFVGIGRFVDKKAPYYTILAFNEVLKQIPVAQLIIGGDGPLLETCKNLVAYLGIGASVQLPGIIDRNNFIKELEDAVAFVQHSVTAPNGDMEGTPVAVLEACAAGITIIATRHAGIPDVIEHGVNGLLVNEHDVTGMAEQMIFLLQNPAEVKRLGAAARKTATENYTMDKHINCIAERIEAAYLRKPSNK